MALKGFAKRISRPAVNAAGLRLGVKSRQGDPLSQLHSAQHMLQAVGISDEEEAVYRVLLQRPRLSLKELAAAADSSTQACSRIVAALEGHGLVSRLPERPARYLPTPPEAAMNILILRRLEELEQARMSAAMLADEYRLTSQQLGVVELVEVVTGRDVIAERFRQLLAGATKEIVAFDKPPYVNPPNASSSVEVLRKGVRVRTVYDKDALEYPGYLPIVREIIQAGEEARTLPGLPMKLVIVDHRIALLPLRLDEPISAGALLVHPSPLLDTLSIFFRSVWEKAVPLTLGAHSTEEDAQAEHIEEWDREILSLLASGLQDKAIASQLELGVRTVQRRARQIMERLGAATRFQAGWLARGKNEA